jgi:hypothetical protein
MRIAPVFVLMLLLSIAACDSVEEVPSEFIGPEYFPLEKGSFITYDVDSTRIIQNVESAHKFQLRISITDAFINGEGNTTYLLQRHKRTDASKPWIPAGTWSAWKSNRQAVVSEGNQSYVKLQFPLSEGIKWNGNALNSNGGDERCDGVDCDQYEVTAMEPEVTVMQNNDSDVLVKQDVRVEKYSKDIGLTYRSVTVLEYCTSGACFGKQFVDNGVRYTQVLIETGDL